MLETIVHESTAEHTGTVIWMHGLGADGHDFESLAPMMDSPHTRFVFPHAPIRPVTINGGIRMRSWYDIRNLASGPYNDRESLEEVEGSHTLLLELIESEQQNGVPF
ncbi:MAG TPA: carboxylesterase, partial [Candidatus Marinimicrobia bacterium]|nr:carboxylesterase [Candidatus Neomarinimicrobiota bacterium]